MPATASPAAQACSVLASVGVLGDFWTLAVVRSAAFGARRYGEFQQELGIASNVLADRLARLTDAGVLEQVPYQHRPTRYDYLLTAAGLELVPVLIALKNWGDRHLQPEGPLTRLQHHGCTGAVELLLRCPDCQQSLGPLDVETVPI
jgi:DNA-binding HxlR family transcriptional regulator